MFSPEKNKIVQILQPKTTNAASNTVWISLKNAARAWIVVNLTQAVGHATVLTVNQATAVAGTGTKVLTNNTRIWANEDVAASDTLARAADAKNYTVAADVKNKQVVFEIDPATCMDINNGFDCIGVNVGASAQVTNFASAEAIVEMKYQAAVPPSVIVD